MPLLLGLVAALWLGVGLAAVTRPAHPPPAGAGAAAVAHSAGNCAAATGSGRRMM